MSLPASPVLVAKVHLSVPADVPVDLTDNVPADIAASVTAAEPVAQHPPPPGPACVPTGDESKQERFEQALEHALPLVQPMPMFIAPPPAALDVQAAVDADLRERLIGTVQRIMVSPPGADVPQVRLVLQDSLLPGTAITIQQVGAQLQVSFECTAQASRQRLDRCAQSLAQSLARRMGRDVLVQVIDETGEALPPVEAHAGASESAL
ncbi:type III secretion HpaP family protein [Diaphorobacter nitroreducens]|uniref:type III secretion HpaP family protein n=1 Tax=Diaphorobacter nitroreducens TaxID=164759 RepID=UPI0035B4DD27